MNQETYRMIKAVSIDQAWRPFQAGTGQICSTSAGAPTRNRNYGREAHGVDCVGTDAYWSQAETRSRAESGPQRVFAHASRPAQAACLSG